jgi:hypothetical protein
MKTNITTKEKITHVINDKDTWLCICGNEPANQGFHTCDKYGVEMEPLIGSNWEGFYFCDKCGRIINKDTLEVVGRKEPYSTRLEEKIRHAHSLLLEVLLEIEGKELDFINYPEGLPSFDEMVCALGAIEIYTKD